MFGPYKLKTPQTCSCGKIHTHTSDEPAIQIEGDALDGIYWNCECKSTMWCKPRDIVVETGLHFLELIG